MRLTTVVVDIPPGVVDEDWHGWYLTTMRRTLDPLRGFIEGDITVSLDAGQFDGPTKLTIEYTLRPGPTPCPICRLPGGFHDVDDQDSRHREHIVPRHLVRPSNTAVRAEREPAVFAVTDPRNPCHDADRCLDTKRCAQYWSFCRHVTGADDGG